MQACELKTLIEEAGKDYVGACLDTGNPMWVMEDPLLTLEVLGPYTVTTHIRDSVVFEHPRGAAAQWVALGDGIVDFKKFVCPVPAALSECGDATREHHRASSTGASLPGTGLLEGVSQSECIGVRAVRRSCKARWATDDGHDRRRRCRDRILLNMMQRCVPNRNSISRKASSTRERRWTSGSAGAT